MKNKLIELNFDDKSKVNGGGFLYDVYRITVAEGRDFIKGFKEGLQRGIF